MKRKRHLRPIRAMLTCYFCGGKVVSLSGEAVRGRGREITAYRCEAEGVRWDVGETLTIYGRSVGEELTQVRTQQDPESGKFVSASA